MKILGGIAFVNEVTFMSKSYSVTAKIRDENIEVKCRKKNINGRLNKISEMPFFRGILKLLTLYKSTRAPLFMLVVLIVLSFILDIMVGLFITDILILTALIVFIKVFVGKYHGAEHKVFNTWSAGRPLTLENVKAFSRVSNRCGTNLVVFIMLIYIPLSFFIPFYLSFLISLSVGYEIFKNKRKAIRKFTKVFYKLGGLLQYVFFTAEPQERELKVALTAFLKLQELEEISKN